VRLFILRKQTLVLIGIVILTALAAVALLIVRSDSLMVLEVTTPAEDSEDIPIYAVETDEKRVALTFDATWGAEYTDELLETLGKHDVKATFFLTNIWMKDYPEKTKSIWAAGHEIGLHSANHKDFKTLSEDEMVEELQENKDLIKSLCSEAEPTLFRPPFGSYDDRLMSVSQEELDLQVIQWSIDSLDWREVNSDYVYNRVITLLHPGAIILFHNNAQPTAEALDDIVTYLAENEYKMIPVSELLHPEPYKVDHRGLQIPE